MKYLLQYSNLRWYKFLKQAIKDHVRNVKKRWKERGDEYIQKQIEKINKKLQKQSAIESFDQSHQGCITKSPARYMSSQGTAQMPPPQSLNYLTQTVHNPIKYQQTSQPFQQYTESQSLYHLPEYLQPSNNYPYQNINSISWNPNLFSNSYRPYQYPSQSPILRSRSNRKKMAFYQYEKKLDEQFKRVHDLQDQPFSKNSISNNNCEEELSPIIPKYINTENNINTPLSHKKLAKISSITFTKTRGNSKYQTPPFRSPKIHKYSLSSRSASRGGGKDEYNDDDDNYYNYDYEERGDTLRRKKSQFSKAAAVLFQRV